MTYREKFLGRCVKQAMAQQLVTICEAKVNEIAPQISVTEEEASWDFYLPENLQVHKGASSEILQEVSYYFFVMISLQFCFWRLMGDGSLTHWLHQNNPKLKGSAGLAQLMIDQYNNGAFPGVHLSKSEVFDEYYNLFKGCGIPLAKERAQILTTLADYDDFKNHTYPNYFDGFDWNLNTACMLANIFEEAYYDPYLKKIQLCMGTVAANFRARGVNVKSNFTAYSDYRLPQILRQMGVLEYHSTLAGIVDNNVPLKSCSYAEEAIRSATVLACEMLAEKASVRATDVDCFLFLKSRDEVFMKNIKPFHLVKTTNY